MGPRDLRARWFDRCPALPTLCPNGPDHGGDSRITRDAKLLNVQQALDVVGVPVDFDSRRLHPLPA
jgi:hypothetical protein